MRFELNRVLFRQLVVLDLVSGFATVIAGLPTLFTGRWYEFSIAFDALVDERFGPRELSQSAEIVLLVLLCAVLTWMLASTIGLLWFKRWARLGFWVAPLIGLAVVGVGEGLRPTMTSPFDDLLGFLNSATFGAVVLLSYAKGFGADWFAPSNPD